MMRKSMKSGFTVAGLLLTGLSANACPACEKQQPEVLRGLVHGQGPDGNMDYIIVAIAVLIVVITLYYSLLWLIRPGEKSPHHIKKIVLNTE
jgi:hypothetical protein